MGGSGSTVNGFAFFGIGIAFGTTQCGVRFILGSSSSGVKRFSLGLLDGIGPVQADTRTERDFAGCSIIADKLVAITELDVAAVIQKKGFVSVLEPADPVDGFGGNTARSGFRTEGKTADGSTRNGSVCVLHTGKEFRRDDGMAVDERFPRIPFSYPVQQVGIGTCWTRRTGFRFRPDERQAVNRPRNGNGNIQRTVVGKDCCSGSNRIGYGLPAVVHCYGGKTRRLDNRSDGKVLVFRITQYDLDGRGQGNGRK